MMMTLTIILAEITVVLLAVVIVITVRALKRRKRDRDAVNTLVISIKANQPARTEKLAGMLKDNNQLSDDDAKNKANDLIKKQNKFYQEAIDLYFTRNNEILSKLDNRLEDLLDQYQSLLKVSGTDNAGVDPEAMEQLSKDIAAMSKEIEELRTENTTLSTQLKAAEQELDQLGREYVSAFNKTKVSKAKDGEESQGDDETAEGEEAEGTEETDDGKDTPADAEENEQIVVESAEPMDDDVVQNETPEVVDASEQTPPAAAVAQQTVAEETVSPETQAPAEQKEEAKVAAVPAQPAAKGALLDDSDEQSLFTDLGLDELIGEQPGQRAVAGKPIDKN